MKILLRSPIGYYNNYYHNHNSHSYIYSCIYHNFYHHSSYCSQLSMGPVGTMAAMHCYMWGWHQGTDKSRDGASCKWRDCMPRVLN